MIVEILTANLIGWDKLRDLYVGYLDEVGGNMTRESVHADHNISGRDAAHKISCQKIFGLSENRHRPWMRPR